MSWGKRITILYLSFVALILTLVFICSGQTIELESKDYYAQELKYQEKIDAMNNANALEHGLDYSVQGMQIALSIPAEQIQGIKGEVYLLRPSDATKDLRLPLHFDANGQQLVNDARLVRGMYKMQLSWEAAGKKYYKEAVVSLQ